MLKSALEPNLIAARQHLKLLTGEDNPVVTFQAFHDSDKRRTDLAWHASGRLDELLPRLKKAQSAGCGVFVCVNQTDGRGRARGNVLAARAAYLDLDGAPLPAAWPIYPSLTIETSPGRFGVFWALAPSDDLNAWCDLQARLAAYYGGDPSVTDPGRVCRLAGFWHRKTETPFQSRIVHADDPADPLFVPWTLAELATKHPCDYRPPHSRADNERAEAPEAGWDNNADVAWAERWLTSDATPSIEGRHGDTNAFQVACALRDRGISEGTALELMLGHWNDRCEPPWDSADLAVKVANAYRYALGPAGSTSPASEFANEPLDAKWEERGNTGNPVDALVNQMNQRYCAVLEGGAFKIFREDIDETFTPPRRVWQRLPREAFRHFYEDERVRLPDAKRDTTLADIWLRSPRRRKYPGLVCDPTNQHGDKLNLWQGWAVKPVPGGDWSLLRDGLIRDVLCAGNAEHFDFVMRWIAFMLQHPAELPEVALAFRGAEGTGKGTLGRTLMKIAGLHGLTVASPAQFTGRFNAHLRDCVFLFADEAFWPGRKDAEGILKQLVTEPVVSFEGKGVDIVPGRNLVHLMLATNNEWVVPAGETARRFAVFDVSDARRNDRTFFGALWAQMEQGGLGGMVHDLMTLDLGDWHPAANIPKTEALADQQVRSAPAEDRWFGGLLEAGALPSNGAPKPNWVRASELYDHGRGSHPDLRYWTDVDFSRYATKQLGRSQKTRRSSGNWWVFPPLAEARESWRTSRPWWPAFDGEDHDWVSEFDEPDEVEQG